MCIEKRQCFKGERKFKKKTVKIEIFLPVKELVFINKYTSSIRFWALSLFLFMFINKALSEIPPAH